MFYLGNRGQVYYIYKEKQRYTDQLICVLFSYMQKAGFLMAPLCSSYEMNLVLIDIAFL